MIMKRNTYRNKEATAEAKDSERETPCSYCGLREHIVSKCPAIRMKRKCAALLKKLTKEQAVEVQVIIDEAFSNFEIHEEQVPQTLKFLLKVLEKVIKEEKEDIIYFVGETAYLGVDLPAQDKNYEGLMVTESTSKRWCEESTREKEDLKQEKSIELGPEIDMVNLIGNYLKIVDTWKSKFRRPEEDRKYQTRSKHAPLRNRKNKPRRKQGERPQIGTEKENTVN
ncbi:13539_t:CDS:2 [Dentiscutata erythropus]|uniref:13539_t:CDS:1 n=1 Tax=Dentiscutata erythropus TaxID=1348616 RepID=A0A9N9JE93_9GLOM|nr:13539_t:CDS:2 [Dentiscutata erythropus]